MKRQALALVALGGAMAVAACSNVLGLKDLEPYPNEGGAEDGSADGPDEESTDAPTTGDATPDADADAADAPSKTDAHEEDGAAVPDATEEDAVTSDVSPDVPQDVSSDTSTSDVVTMDVTQDTTPPMDSPPGCEAGEVLCGGTCVNTTNDGSHCGGCGHSCLGGTCTSSTCNPVQIYSGSTPYDIVEANGVLYWVDQNATVYKCTASSCAGTAKSIATSQKAPTRIAWDGAHTIFWTNNGNGSTGSIGKYDTNLNVAGTLTSSVTAPVGIAADTTYVFWTDVAVDQVARFDRSTGGTPATLSTGNGTAPEGMALCSLGVCWTEAESGTAGSVRYSAESGWTSTILQGSQDAPWALSTTGSTVYWVDYDSPGSVQCSTGNSIAGQTFPVRVASDATAVYWTDQGSGAANGSLMTAAPQLASAATTVVTALAMPVGLAMDSSAVYYGTTGSAAPGLWLLARP